MGPQFVIAREVSGIHPVQWEQRLLCQQVDQLAVHPWYREDMWCTQGELKEIINENSELGFVTRHILSLIMAEVPYSSFYDVLFEYVERIMSKMFEDSDPPSVIQEFQHLIRVIEGTLDNTPSESSTESD